jgi:glutathione synthase/RimK-type ligase-like ATP-grasp enzyme
MSKFRVKIRSRHSTHDPLREKLGRTPVRTIVRLGSSYPTPQNGRNYLEVNTVEAIKNSANKLLMKQCFQAGEVRTADWWRYAQASQTSHQFFIGNGEALNDITEMKFPIVAKHIFGSRGTGNYLLKSQAELEAWLPGKTLANYIFEKFYSYNREYRIHVTAQGAFYTCRKLLKNDTPQDKRWFRNDSNSNWIVETNESFDKPVNWDAIVAESVKALNAIGLDFGAVDVRVQSASKETKKKGEVVRENPDFIIIEINSAPSFGDITLEKYLEEIPKIIASKTI